MEKVNEYLVCWSRFGFKGHRMILTGFLLAAAMFLSIFLRGMQQRNNIHNEWGWIWPCSQGMAWVDYPLNAFVISTIWTQGITTETAWYIFMSGNGAAAGCMYAMWRHNRKLARGL